MPRKQNTTKKRATSNSTRQQTSSRAAPGQKQPAADSNSSATKRPKRTAQMSRSPRPLTTDDLPTLIQEVCSNLSKDTREKTAKGGEPPARMSQDRLRTSGRHCQGAEKMTPIKVTGILQHLLTTIAC